MNLVGLILTRNSDWAIGLSLRSMLMFCDHAIVLMHHCTDSTWDIVQQIAVEEYLGRVHMEWDASSNWEEMRLRQQMLTHARQRGATHIWLQDDDELLVGSLLPVIRKHVEETPPGQILQLPWLCLKEGIGNVMTTGVWGNATVSVAFKDDPAWHWARPAGQTDFHHRHPYGRQFVPHRSPACVGRGAGLMHLQFASERRLLAKQYLYQLVERARWPDIGSVAKTRAMYEQTVYEYRRSSIGTVPPNWWEPYAGILHHLKLDAEPWQEAEVRRMLAEQPELAAGLNDFGLNKCML